MGFDEEARVFSAHELGPKVGMSTLSGCANPGLFAGLWAVESRKYDPR